MQQWALILFVVNSVGVFDGNRLFTKENTFENTSDLVTIEGFTSVVRCTDALEKAKEKNKMIDGVCVQVR